MRFPPIPAIALALLTRPIAAGQQDSDKWAHPAIFTGDRSKHPPPKDFSWSQLGQDMVVAGLFGCKTGGFFIDLAANHAFKLSNTAGLEATLGWNGLCVEPNSAYWMEHATRKCQLVGAVVSEGESEVTFSFQRSVGGIRGVRAEKEKYLKVGDTHDVVMPTVPIRTILQKFNAPRTIDYMSLDVEGAEYLVLEHFPFDEYKICLLTIEMKMKGPIPQLLHSRGYKHILELGRMGEHVWIHETCLADLDKSYVQKLRALEMPIYPGKTDNKVIFPGPCGFNKAAVVGGKEAVDQAMAPFMSATKEV